MTRITVSTAGRFLALGAAVLAAAAFAYMVLSSRTADRSSLENRSNPFMSNRADDSGSPTDPNDQKWRSKLTREQYHVTREKGTEARSRASTGITRVQGDTSAYAVARRSLIQRPSTIPARDGPASRHRSRNRASRPAWIPACSLSEPRCCARAATLISGTCSTTALAPPACATALIRPRWILRKPSPRRKPTARPARERADHGNRNSTPGTP